MTPSRNPAARRAAGAVDLARAGGRDARIEIADYDNAWPVRYREEVRRLAEIVPDLDFHHIGSTAVPGLPAKPIIDMMAIAVDLDVPVPVLVDQAGYQYPAAYNATLGARRWLCRPSASYRTHHLHLVADGDVLARHLRFRDTLRSEPQLAAEYGTLKRDLATRLAGDREGYTAAKTAFVEKVEALS